MKIVWTWDARHDMRSLISYIAERDRRAALKMQTTIRSAIAQLETLPQIGRPGAIPGMRELIPHPNYRIVYEIRPDSIWIIAIVHTARQWPPEGGL